MSMDITADSMQCNAPVYGRTAVLMLITAGPSADYQSCTTFVVIGASSRTTLTARLQLSMKLLVIENNVK